MRSLRSSDKRLSTLRVNQIADLVNGERAFGYGRKFWNKLEGKLKHRDTSGTKDMTTLKTGDGIVLIADT